MRSSALRVLFGVAVVLLIGNAVLLASFVLGDDDSSPRESDITQAAVRSGSGTGPVAVSASGIKTLAQALRQPIYWAGPQRGYRYSLRQASDGKFYVRYLPPGVRAEDRARSVLIVATYPERNALAELREEAETEGGFMLAIPRGGLAYYPDEESTSVYVAYPGSRFRVEVFDPRPQRALRLAAEGRIMRVG